MFLLTLGTFNLMIEHGDLCCRRAPFCHRPLPARADRAQRSAAQCRPQNMCSLIIGYDSIVRRPNGPNVVQIVEMERRRSHADRNMRCTGGYRTAGLRISAKMLSTFLDNEVERLTTKRTTNRLSVAFALCSALVSCGIFFFFFRRRTHIAVVTLYPMPVTIN